MSSPTPGPKSPDEINASELTASMPIRVRRRRRDGNTHRRRKHRNRIRHCGTDYRSFHRMDGIQRIQVKDNLEAARDHAQAAKNALLTGETEEAKRSAADADKYATLARSGTHSLPWNILSPIPFIALPFLECVDAFPELTGMDQ